MSGMTIENVVRKAVGHVEETLRKELGEQRAREDVLREQLNLSRKKGNAVTEALTHLGTANKEIAGELESIPACDLCFSKTDGVYTLGCSVSQHTSKNHRSCVGCDRRAAESLRSFFEVGKQEGGFYDAPLHSLCCGQCKEFVPMSAMEEWPMDASLYIQRRKLLEVIEKAVGNETDSVAISVRDDLASKGVDLADGMDLLLSTNPLPFRIGFCSRKDCNNVFLGVRDCHGDDGNESRNVYCGTCSGIYATQDDRVPWCHVPVTPVKCDSCGKMCVREEGIQGACSHETCPHCGYEFCYICGGELTSAEDIFWTYNFEISAVATIPYCGKPASTSSRKFGDCKCFDRQRLERAAAAELEHADADVNDLLHTRLMYRGNSNDIIIGYGYKKLTNTYVSPNVSGTYLTAEEARREKVAAENAVGNGNTVSSENDSDNVLDSDSDDERVAEAGSDLDTPENNGMDEENWITVSRVVPVNMTRRRTEETRQFVRNNSEQRRGEEEARREIQRRDNSNQRRNGGQRRIGATRRVRRRIEDDADFIPFSSPQSSSE